MMCTADDGLRPTTGNENHFAFEIGYIGGWIESLAKEIIIYSIGLENVYKAYEDEDRNSRCNDRKEHCVFSRRSVFFEMQVETRSVGDRRRVI